MNYLFQVDLLRDRTGDPVVGYSGQHLDQLNETSLGAVSFLGSDRGRHRFRLSRVREYKLVYVHRPGR